MQYELHLNLQQRATLKIAISFWEKKEVKDKATELFKSCDKLEIWEARKKWDEFMKTVINDWNKELLPQKLEVKSIHLVKMIGETIFNWYYYIKHEYKEEGEAITCIDKIHWTPYGTVDPVQIFNSFWLNNPNLDITKVYDFACTHMIEDHINELWNKIPTKIKYKKYRDMYRHFNRHIIAYWKCYRDGDLSNLIEYFEGAADIFNRQYMLELSFIYDLDRSTEENMLRLSAYQGYYSAMKYFWEKLTEQERDESIVKCARIAVLCCYHYRNEHQSVEHYEINEYNQICIFLMNQMTDSHKKKFFNEELKPLELRFNGWTARDARDEILRMLLSGWPWQELFLPVLKDMIRLLDDDSMMSCSFLGLITKKMSNDYLPGYSAEMSIYRSLFRKVWLIIPGTVKQELPQINRWAHFIYNLIDIWDIDSLKLIFDDPEIADVRDDYINFGANSYANLITDDKTETIDKLFREIFKSDEEINRYKKSLKLISYFIHYDEHDYDSADRFLDWVCSTHEERKAIKKREFDEIFDTLIRMQNTKILDKFFDWTFETEEEKKQPKNRLKNHGQIMSWIWCIWTGNKTNVNKSKEESSQFLHWLYESEEEIALCKRELFDSERNEMNMYIVRKLNEGGILTDILSWCELPQEGVQRLEQALAREHREL